MAGAAAGGLVQVSLLFQRELGGQAIRRKQPVLFYAGATISDVLAQSAGTGGVGYPLWPWGFGDLATSKGAQFLALCRDPGTSEEEIAGPDNACLLAAFFSDFIPVASAWKPVTRDVVLADLMLGPCGAARSHVEICITLHFPSGMVGTPSGFPLAAPKTRSPQHMASVLRLGGFAAKSVKTHALQSVYTAETCATLEQVPALSRQSSCSSFSSDSSVVSLPSTAPELHHIVWSSPHAGDRDGSEKGCAARKISSSITFRAPPGLDRPDTFNWVPCSETSSVKSLTRRTPAKSP